MTPFLVDPFVDRRGRPRLVRGVAVQTYSPRVAELAGLAGFETIWIDIEHGPAGYGCVEALCMAAESAGCVASVRVPDNSRHHLLRTVEAGAQIVVVPMINDAASAAQIVQHAKFPPLGRRGFNLRSRGLDYGIGPLEENRQEANRRTHLFAQIETLQAAENVEAICRVPGLAGIVIGPGDLSADMGRPGQFDDPQLVATVESVVRAARQSGGHAGLVASPGPLLEAALAAGCDLAYCSSDLGSLTTAWSDLLDALPGRLPDTDSAPLNPTASHAEDRT